MRKPVLGSSNMRRGTRRLIARSLSVVLILAMVGTGTAQALTSTTQPQLTLNHLIRTSPFQGSSTTVRDNEGSAYVASDDSLWMASDNDDALFEVNRTTGALRRMIEQSAFINAPRFGVGGTAGQARTEDLESLAYDANADVLYAFSGSTSATPTSFRLIRDGNNRFQVESWQSMSSEWTAAGWRSADGLTYVANGSTIRTYNFATNTLGPSFSISGLSSIYGIDFDDVTGDLLAVNSSERLYRASMTARTLLAGWSGISLTGLGLRDTRAVEVIGEQLLVTDGDDGRAASDPMNHAVFVLDVTGPGGPAPTASFTATPTTGTVPLVVNFTDTSSGTPTSWAWEFGDGGTSTEASPSHTYTSTGTWTATLTATNEQGSSSYSRTITVNEPSAPTASFTATPTTGSVPLVVNFTDTSSGTPTSWDWDFGDGGTSTEALPSHTYTSTGTFTATLTATNELGSSSTSRTITVNEAPTELALDADTYVKSSSPTKNYASAPTMKLKTPNPSEYRTLVKFTLSGLSDAPSSVKLRLYVTDASSRGGDWYLVSNAWIEGEVVWDNKPDVSGSPVASVGAIVVGTWVEIDLTGAITGNGTYSFEATSTSTNTAAFSTSQGTNAPQVIVIP